MARHRPAIVTGIVGHHLWQAWTESHTGYSKWLVNPQPILDFLEDVRRWLAKIADMTRFGPFPGTPTKIPEALRDIKPGTPAHPTQGH